MSDKEVRKVHEKAAEKDRHAHNHTLGGTADDAGIIARNAANPDLKEENPEQKKKKARELEMLLFQLELAAEVDVLMDRFDDKMLEYKQSVERMKKLQSAYDRDDLDQMKGLLSEQGHTTNYWSDKQVREMTKEQIELEQYTQEKLEQEMHDILIEANRKSRHPALSEEQLKSIQQKCQIRLEALKAETTQHNNLVELTGVGEKVYYNDAEDTLNDRFEGTFTKAGQVLDDHHHSYQKVLSIESEQTRRLISFSSMLDKDDPFMAEAGSISVPFNHVASQIKCAGTNLENNEQQITVITDHELKPISPKPF